MLSYSGVPGEAQFNCQILPCLSLKNEKNGVQKKPFQKDLIPERHLPKKQDAYMRKEKKTKVK